MLPPFGNLLITLGLLCMTQCISLYCPHGLSHLIHTLIKHESVQRECDERMYVCIKISHLEYRSPSSSFTFLCHSPLALSLKLVSFVFVTVPLLHAVSISSISLNFQSATWPGTMSDFCFFTLHSLSHHLLLDKPFSVILCMMPLSSVPAVSQRRVSNDWLLKNRVEITL